jgi:hypothetical protein
VGKQRWQLRLQHAALVEWPSLHAIVTNSQATAPSPTGQQSPLHESVHALLQEEDLLLAQGHETFLQQYSVARNRFVQEFACKFSAAWEMAAGVSNVGDIYSALRHVLLRSAAQFVLCITNTTPSPMPAAQRRSPRLGGRQ